MKNPIPQDWNGETWRCVEVQWPDSTGWLSLLAGFLSYAMRGRSWDERTGSILDAQAAGWEIWNRNMPFRPCVTCPEPEPCPEPESISGGAIIEEEVDMGQVVTNVTLENGTLYIWFGPCCKIEVGALAGAAGITPYGENPFGEGPFYACGKLTSVMDVLWAIGLSVWDEKDNSYVWQWPGNVKSDVPGYDLSTQAIVAAVIDAKIVDATYGESEVFDANIWAEIKASFVDQLDDSDSGMSSSEFTALRATIIGAFAAHGRVQAGAWWALITEVLGAGDADKAAILGSTDSAADCSLPETFPPAGFGSGMDWAHTLNFEGLGELPANFTANGDTYLWVGHGIIAHVQETNNRTPVGGSWDFAAPNPVSTIKQVAILFTMRGDEEYDTGDVHLGAGASGAGCIIQADLEPLTGNAPATAGRYTALKAVDADLSASDHFKCDIACYHPNGDYPDEPETYSNILHAIAVAGTGADPI